MPNDVLVSRLILCFAVAFNLYYLFPQVAIDVPQLNDGVLHLLTLGYVNGSLHLSPGFADPWMPPVAMGYPLLHYYQQLPYFPPVIVHKLIFWQFADSDLQLDIVSAFLLFPRPTLYWSMRRVRVFPGHGGDRWFIRLTHSYANGLYGFDYNSYVWRG